MDEWDKKYILELKCLNSNDVMSIMNTTQHWSKQRNNSKTCIYR